MQVGMIVGTATSTKKHPSMDGWKLIVVQPLMADRKSPDGEPVLAVDRLGAGVGEAVIISSDGKSTRAMLNSDTTPVRWSVIGIPNSFEAAKGK